MLIVAARINLEPAKALEYAMSYFGPEGYRLDITAQESDFISLEGGGGVVEIRVCPDGKGTRIEFFTQDWDKQVREFIKEIKEIGHGSSNVQRKSIQREFSRVNTR